MKLSKQIQIFVVYARSDREVVDRLYQQLVKAGANVWLDRETLLPGQDWQYEIRKAIQGSDLTIVCLSRQFNKQGGYRHEELKIALRKASSLPEGQTFIIPARLDNSDMPEPLRRWQRVDLFDSKGYKVLLEALRQYSLSR